MVRGFISMLVLLASGCDGAPVATDSGEPVACDEPARACPAAQPYDGAPCDLTESCPYVPMDGIEWTFTCVGGEWVGSVECMLIGGGCAPPLAETCSTAVRDHGSGTVEMGPVAVGSFTPFVDGQPLAVTIGGQGTPMIQYRLRLAETAPSCVEVITTFRSALHEDVVDRRSLRLRCGRSLGLFVLVPNGMPCDGTPEAVELEVEVVGIGTTSANVEVPGDAFCPLIPG